MQDKFDMNEKVLIGTGRTGKIYKVLCKNTNEMRAIKIIEKG